MTLKKKYFKNGYILTARNGNNYVVMNFGHYTDYEHKNKCEDVLCNLNLCGYLRSDRFNDNMENMEILSEYNGFDIVKVSVCNFPTNIWDTEDNGRTFWDTVWERED